MPYCTNCGIEISNYERHFHNNLCDECFQQHCICLKCGRILSEQEVHKDQGHCLLCYQKQKIPHPRTQMRIYPPVFGFRCRPRLFYHAVFIIYTIILFICIIMALLFDRYGIIYLIVVMVIISPFLFFLYKKNKSKKKAVKEIIDEDRKLEEKVEIEEMDDLYSKNK